jgi:SAM-dependent methyltransferase
MIKLIVDFYNRKVVRSQKARWNYQYAKGKWDGLKNERELERQGFIKDYFLNYGNKSGSLIEFGCGFGVLPDVIFQKKHYSHYVGVDISDYIIQKIQPLADARHVFEIGDFENYHFKEKYDYIVFNECINYSKDIPKLLSDCRDYGLKKGGLFIISVHKFKRSPEIWEAIHDNLTVLETRTIVKNKNTWQVEILKWKD